MIALGSDHAGFNLKQSLIKYFKDNNIDYIDVGCFSDESCDYPVIAKEVCALINKGECETGILICGTGIGLCISANKIKGIRAALCHDCVSAKCARTHNNANVLVLGGRIIGSETALEITRIFLASDFSNEQRHIDRVKQIEEGE